MIKLQVNFQDNFGAIKKRIDAARDRGVTIGTNEFIKDANFYCRVDTHETQRSAIRESKPEEGLAIWGTNYAKKAYYTGYPSTDKNPNASLMWADKAAKEHREKYENILKKCAREG